MEKKKAGIQYRKQHKHRRRLHLPRGLPLLLLSVLAVTGTLMYLTARTTTAVNAFSVGAGQIQIIEPGIDPDAVQWGSGSKPVQLHNPAGDGNAAGAVRAMMVPYLTDASTGERLGGNLGALSAPSGNTMSLGDLTFHLEPDWNSHWFYKDGFFYYRKILAPGETTTKLLSGVTLAAGKEAEYENISVKVDVVADLLQKDGSAAGTEWGVTVNENTVSP